MICPTHQSLIVLYFSSGNTEEEAGLEKNFGGAVKSEPLGEKQRRRGRLSLKKGKGGQRKLLFQY